MYRSYCITLEKLILGKCISTAPKPQLDDVAIDFEHAGELRYDGPLYDGFLHMTDDMLGPSPMHMKYSSYVYDGFCI